MRWRLLSRCLLHHHLLLLRLRGRVIVGARRRELLLLLLLLGWRGVVVVRLGLGLRVVVVTAVVAAVAAGAALRDDAHVVGGENAFALGVDVLATPPVVVQLLEHLHALALVQRQIRGPVGLEVVHGLAHLHATAAVRWGSRGRRCGRAAHQSLLVAPVAAARLDAGKGGQGRGAGGVLGGDLVHELVKQLGRDDV